VTGSRKDDAGPLVVVGDALLDVDLEGSAARLMPEAPVPVLDGLREWPRPGGAALAAALLAGDRQGGGGAAPVARDVVLVASVADDEAGRRVRELLVEAGVGLRAIPYDGGTPVKRRVRAGGQSLLRLDDGGAGAPGRPPTEAVAAIDAAGAVLVSDYGRGVTSLPEVRAALGRAAGRVPVVWDPHPRGAAPVAGVRLATPNAGEAARLAPHSGRAGLGAVADQAAALVQRWQVHAVAVTLGASGALLSHGDTSPAVVPAPPLTAVDSCGAGDRFASAALAALAGGAVTLEAVQAGVAAASAFVAAGGAAAYGRAASQVAGGSDPGDPVAQVRARGGTVVATGGCFDLLHAGHVATLEAARALGDCLVVCLNSDDSVRRLKGPSRPLVPQADRARVLRALECVDDVVVFGEDTPEAVLRRLRPDVWAKGGDYTGALLPEAEVLSEWGGQAVVLPYLEGRSTTGLVATARR
jgi:rfaE bifunctional protein nucleotidyltransferase chain/domain